MMVSLEETRDKFGQQRQGRTDGAIRSTADRRPMGEDPSLASETTPTSAWRQTTGQRSQSARRDSACGFCAAGLAGRICPLTSFLHRQLAGGDFGIGKSEESWLTIWRAFLAELNQHAGALDWSESFLDGSFAPARKKGLQSRKNQAGQGQEVDGGSRRRGYLPLGKRLCSASPNEVRLAEEALTSVQVTRRHRRGRPRPETAACDCRSRLRRLDPLPPAVGGTRDRGDGSTPPLESQPAAHPDGRALRRYRRRWKVERTLAWLGNFRRLVVHYDRFVHDL